MLRTVEITFGGLCLFVQREVFPKGLYVLMPDAPAMPGEMERHCPMVITEPSNTPRKRSLLIPFKGQDLDLTWLAPHGQSIGNLKGWLAEVSRYNNGLPVDSDWFQGMPKQCLAARVRLPLGTTVAPAGKAGQVQAPDGSQPCVHGLATATVPDVSAPTDEIAVAGQLMQADAAGSIKLGLINVPRSHLDGQNRPHKKKKPAYHIRTYHWLLKGNCAEHRHGPDVTFLEDYTPPAGSYAPPQPCPTEVEDVPHLQLSSRFIDPYNCTVGLGCPEEDPQC